MSAPTPFDERPYRRGVGIMLLDDVGRVFVGRRIDSPDAWQMPQGGLDDGETPVDCARRELCEEIGTDRAVVVAESDGWLEYDLPRDIADRSWRGRYRGQSQKWFAMRFQGTDADINVATAEPEFDAWQWVAPQQALDLIIPFKRTVYEAVLREFADVLTAEAR